jgi:hypothetical protein
MKPNQQELEIIEDLLGSATKYRETYEELYDHILSALETTPNQVLFDDALYHIVEHELGGKAGIIKIEAKYSKAAIKDIAKKYLTYFGRYLVSPFALIAIVLTVLIFWLIAIENIKGGGIGVICFIQNSIPLLVRKIIIIKARHKGVYGKSSVVKIAYPYLKLVPVLLFIAFIFIYNILTAFSSMPDRSVNYIIVTVFFFNMINILTICRLYKDEFKSITTT